MHKEPWKLVPVPMPDQTILFRVVVADVNDTAFSTRVRDLLTQRVKARLAGLPSKCKPLAKFADVSKEYTALKEAADTAANRVRALEAQLKRAQEEADESRLEGIREYIRGADSYPEAESAGPGALIRELAVAKHESQIAAAALDEMQPVFQEAKRQLDSAWQALTRKELQKLRADLGVEQRLALGEVETAVGPILDRYLLAGGALTFFGLSVPSISETVLVEAIQHNEVAALQEAAI
jgi:hypothetical protein